jgi:allophanate hydrolase subunit 2
MFKMHLFITRMGIRFGGKILRRWDLKHKLLRQMDTGKGVSVYPRGSPIIHLYLKHPQKGVLIDCS